MTLDSKMQALFGLIAVALSLFGIAALWLEMDFIFVGKVLATGLLIALIIAIGGAFGVYHRL